MKELSGTACNYYYTDKNEKGKQEPIVEMILILSEKQYNLEPDELTRKRVAETIRFITPQGGVKKLLSHLLEIDKQLSEMRSGQSAG